PRFGPPPRGERAASLGLVSSVAIGDGDEPYPVPECGVLGGDAARSLVAVIGMGAKRDDVELAIRTRRLRALERGLLPPADGAGRCTAVYVQRKPGQDGERCKALHRRGLVSQTSVQR